MFDINIKYVKKGKGFFYAFFVVGLIFLLVFGGIYVSSMLKLKKLDSTILSTKVEVKSYINDEGSTMYSPVYYYEVNGDNYICNSSSSASVNPGTQNKTVYYDSNNPSNCMTEFSKSGNIFVLISLIIPISFILLAIINIIKINNRIKIIMKLNQNGKLVKNLTYRLEDSNMKVQGVPIKRPVVDYTLSSGTTITLYGDPRHDRVHYDEDGMVDLLIDESNPNNYFIDFEINRLTGNLPQDYFGENNYNNKM